jgi:CHAT domain-containing protein
MNRKPLSLIFLALIAIATPTLTERSVNAAIAQTSSPQSLLQQGIQHYEAQQYPEAARIWQQAASAFARQNDPLNEALVLSNLSLTYQHLGQWDEAENAIAQSLQLLQNQPDSEILAKALNAQGRLQWAKGQLEQAIATWKQATSVYAKVGHQAGVVGSSLNQAKALQALGLSLQAKERLERVNQILENEANPTLKAAGLRQLGSTLRQVGELERSRQVLRDSLELSQPPNGKSLTLLELGNTERALGNQASTIGRDAEARQYRQDAIASYQQAATISDSQAQLQPLLNQLSLLVETGQHVKAMSLYPQLQGLIADLPPSRSTIYARLNFARSLTCLQPNIEPEAFTCPRPTTEAEHPSWQEIAQIIATAVQQARHLNDPIAESHALGQLGELYELTGERSPAQDLTEQALLRVEGLQAADLRYRWEWQLGRLLEKQGRRKSATTAYQRAVKALESIRGDLLAVDSDVQFSFRDNVEPVYRGLVDLLLTTEDGTKPSQENLKQAIHQVDSLQLAELENFLGCNLANVVQVEQVSDPNAAIIYPIILEDRLAIIFELPGSDQLDYVETPIPQGEVEQTLRQLREHLTIPGNTPEVLEAAQKVYRWLVARLEPALENSDRVETLVFVLDGTLRNIPMAVLYDGEEYLIEKDYAIAVAPRLELFSPKASEGELNVFAGGIGIPQVIGDRQFPQIEKLGEELQRITQKVNANQPLLNEAFTTTNIERQLESGNYSAIHWKTHGTFSSDPEETFIVAYQESIKAQELNSLIQAGSQGGAAPLELLVLSACETARGDDRAVLGLAGIAVRTGTRSVLSTLWVAKDAPNTEFMVRFYEELSEPGVTKAQAVRRAQLALLQEYGYTTPHIWGTYVLVGNWL